MLGTQLVNSSRSLEIAVNYSWWLVVGLSLISQDRKFRVWIILSSEENVG